MSRYAAVGLLFLLVGCAHPKRAASFRLENNIVAPPRPYKKQISVSGLTPRNRGTGCDIEGPVRLRLKGPRARAFIAPEAYLDAQPPHVSREAFRQFHDRLTALADKGCVTRTESSKILDAVFRSLRLPTDVAHELQYGAYRSSGYVDILPGMALRCVTPLLKSAGYVLPTPPTLSPPTAPGQTIEIRTGGNFLGFETAYFSVGSSTEGLTIQPVSIERMIDGKKETSDEPANTFLYALRSHPAKWLRLVFLTRASGADHDMAILAANTQAELDDGAKRLQSTPNARCSVGESAACVWVPAEIAVRPEIAISANGVPTFVPLGATVRELIGPQAAAAVGTLQIRRRYGLEFYPVEWNKTSSGVLSLVADAGRPDYLVRSVAQPRAIPCSPTAADRLDSGPTKHRQVAMRALPEREMTR